MAKTYEVHLIEEDGPIESKYVDLYDSSPITSGSRK